MLAQCISLLYISIVHRPILRPTEHNWCSLAGTAPVYLADECTLVTAAGRRPLGSADNRTCLVKRSCNQFDDRCFATTAGQRCGTVCLNSFGNRISPLDNSNDHWKRLCLVGWAVAPCVWTLRAPTRNRLTYLCIHYTGWISIHHILSVHFIGQQKFCSTMYKLSLLLTYTVADGHIHTNNIISENDMILQRGRTFEQCS